MIVHGQNDDGVSEKQDTEPYNENVKRLNFMEKAQQNNALL